MHYTCYSIDPFLGILVAMVFILEVKPSRPVSQFQASLTKLSALLQVGVQFRYNETPDSTSILTSNKDPEGIQKGVYITGKDIVI